MLKNYYDILEINPAASLEEVKKAFRKLALVYHPDKHDNQDIAEVRFAEIYEAYTVLNDPESRKKYDRLVKGNNVPVFKHPATAGDILELSISLQMKLSRLDPFRTDRDLVHFEIHYLLSLHNLEILEKESNPVINRQIITNIIRCAPYLPYGTIREITPLIKKLVIHDEGAKKQVELFVRDNERDNFWNRYKVVGALIFALLTCLFIFYASRK